jgi:intracellular sulfur oxidation DsrE/DsrF family protein
MKQVVKRAVLGSLLVLGSLGMSTAALAVEKEKVVIQVSQDDAAAWNLALNNAKNIQKDVGADKVDIEVVAFGPGLEMLKLESEVANRIGEMVDSGVKVVACQNTMRNRKVEPADINPKAGFVPSGVVEIMRRQQQGYAYLRP